MTTEPVLDIRHLQPAVMECPSDELVCLPGRVDCDVFSRNLWVDSKKPLLPKEEPDLIVDANTLRAHEDVHYRAAAGPRNLPAAVKTRWSAGYRVVGADTQHPQ